MLQVALLGIVSTVVGVILVDVVMFEKQHLRKDK